MSSSCCAPKSEAPQNKKNGSSCCAPPKEEEGASSASCCAPKEEASKSSSSSCCAPKEEASSSCCAPKHQQQEASTSSSSCCAPKEEASSSTGAPAAEAVPTVSKDDTRDAVRRAYATTAEGGPSILPLDCGDVEKRRELLGYAEGELNELAEGADLGLGCGNPLSVADLKRGEVVVDLGSGAGVDCFAAATQVGPTGRVVGVDMTPEMLQKARGILAATKDPVAAKVVSFRLGEIEHLPLGDGVADCVISNCVINLSLDKPQVYREMHRVLKPGGRVAISDVLRTSEIPDELKTEQSFACWVAGASADDEMRAMLSSAGFEAVSVEVKSTSREIISAWMPGSRAEDYVASAYVTATKPLGEGGAAAATTSGDDLFREPDATLAAAPQLKLADAGAPQAAGCWG